MNYMSRADCVIFRKVEKLHQTSTTNVAHKATRGSIGVSCAVENKTKESRADSVLNEKCKTGT